jgi:hypothetical protein
MIDFNALRIFEQQAQAIKRLEERIEKLENNNLEVQSKNDVSTRAIGQSRRQSKGKAVS